MGNRERGFVDPLYMIFFTVVITGVALVVPIIEPIRLDQPIQVWHWVCLGLGIAVLAGCVWFIKREHAE
jgi:hypothetical protein